MRIAILILISAIPISAKVNLAGVASVTTIVANAGTISKLVRHPSREGKKVGAEIKKFFKGKN